MLMFKVYSIFNSWYQPFAPRKVVYTDEKKSLIFTYLNERKNHATQCTEVLSELVEVLKHW